VELGADVDARDANQMTALHWACEHAQVEVVHALVMIGADVEAENARGCTPLHMAVASAFTTSRAHGPYELKCLISRCERGQSCTNPVSISSVPIQTVR
jgi:ankyrin repeat protein